MNTESIRVIRSYFTCAGIVFCVIVFVNSWPLLDGYPDTCILVASLGIGFTSLITSIVLGIVSRISERLDELTEGIDQEERT